MKRLLALVVVGAIAGCTVDDPPVTRGCTSLADCARGLVCDERINQCVPEPLSGLIGSFSCRVYAAGDPATEFLGSEILGNVGGDRWSLPLGAICHRQSSGNLEIQVLPAAGPGALDVTLAGASADAGGSTPLHPAAQLGDPGSAALWDPDRDLAFGYSVGGVVFLSRPAAVGAVVGGFVAIDMSAAAKVDGQVGAACPNGVGDCGRSVQSGSPLCQGVTFTSGESNAVCAVPCSTPSDCSAYPGAVCTNGVCTSPCNASTDCAPGLFCVTGQGSEPSGCL